MVKVEKYRCEFCNTEYKLKVDAEECERNHVSPVKIKKAEYHPYKHDFCGLPKAINIEMSDGRVIKYVRGGSC